MKEFVWQVCASQKKLSSLEEFGQSTGLAFQVIDDILDVTQSSETLGKSAGKDEAVNKATYPSIHGLEKSKKIAEKLTVKAIGEGAHHTFTLAEELGVNLIYTGHYQSETFGKTDDQNSVLIEMVSKIRKSTLSLCTVIN